MRTGILCGAKNARCFSSADLMAFVIGAPTVRAVSIGVTNDAVLNLNDASCLKDGASAIPNARNSGNTISSL